MTKAIKEILNTVSNFLQKASKVRRSRLKIWFMAIGIVLVSAFVISGGKLEVTVAPPEIRIEMPPIAEGLAKLKDVFRKN